MYDKTYTFNKTCNVDRNGADTFKIAAYTLSKLHGSVRGAQRGVGDGGLHGAGVSFQHDGLSSQLLSEEWDAAQDEWGEGHHLCRVAGCGMSM